MHVAFALKGIVGQLLLVFWELIAEQTLRADAALMFNIMAMQGPVHFVPSFANATSPAPPARTAAPIRPTCQNRWAADELSVHRSFLQLAFGKCVSFAEHPFAAVLEAHYARLAFAFHCLKVVRNCERLRR